MTDKEMTEVDETAVKAVEIGKELGITEDKPEDAIPDYDVEELPDEKIAKERQSDPEPKIKKERPKLTNKEKRALKKQNLNEKFRQKDAEIEHLRKSNEELAKWRDEVTGRLATMDRNSVETALGSQLGQFEKAERDHKEAFKEGDADKATDAMKRMYHAKQHIDKLNTLKAQLEKRPARETRQEGAVDNAAMRKANTWAKEHHWYNPSGTDIDSEIAKAVSGVLVNEGFGPNQDDFWDELDSRLAEKIPHKYAESKDEEEYDDEEEEEERPRRVEKKRVAPPVAGNAGSRGDIKGKVSVSLPTAFINTMKENGIWEDKAKRDRVIQRYLSQQREARNA